MNAVGGRTHRSGVSFLCAEKNRAGKLGQLPAGWRMPQGAGDRFCFLRSFYLAAACPAEAAEGERKGGMIWQREEKIQVKVETKR